MAIELWSSICLRKVRHEVDVETKSLPTKDFILYSTSASTI